MVFGSTVDPHGSFTSDIAGTSFQPFGPKGPGFDQSGLKRDFGRAGGIAAWS